MKKLTTESHWRNVYYIKKKQKKNDMENNFVFCTVQCDTIT